MHMSAVIIFKIELILQAFPLKSLKLFFLLKDNMNFIFSN